MAIKIRITNEVIGTSQLYSEKNMQGEVVDVPLYRMVISNDTGETTDFSVTRDTIVTTFGEPTNGHYGTNDECPPNRPGVPYHGVRMQSPKIGFVIQFYEPELGIARNQDTIKGIGDVLRTEIQIHIGPAKSEGCFLLDRREEGLAEFEQCIARLIEQDRVSGISQPDEIRIWVEDRHV